MMCSRKPMLVKNGAAYKQITKFCLMKMVFKSQWDIGAADSYKKITKSLREVGYETVNSRDCLKNICEQMLKTVDFSAVIEYHLIG